MSRGQHKRLARLPEDARLESRGRGENPGTAAITCVRVAAARPGPQ